MKKLIVNEMLYEVICTNPNCVEFEKVRKVFIVDMDYEDNLHYECDKCHKPVTILKRRRR